MRRMLGEVPAVENKVLLRAVKSLGYILVSLEHHTPAGKAAGELGELGGWVGKLVGRSYRKVGKGVVYSLVTSVAGADDAVGADADVDVGIVAQGNDAVEIGLGEYLVAGTSVLADVVVHRKMKGQEIWVRRSGRCRRQSPFYSSLVIDVGLCIMGASGFGVKGTEYLVGGCACTPSFELLPGLPASQDCWAFVLEPCLKESWSLVFRGRKKKK